jgi:hypothetical protein
MRLVAEVWEGARPRAPRVRTGGSISLAARAGTRALQASLSRSRRVYHLVRRVRGENDIEQSHDT